MTKLFWFGIALVIFGVSFAGFLIAGVIQTMDYDVKAIEKSFPVANATSITSVGAYTAAVEKSYNQTMFVKYQNLLSTESNQITATMISNSIYPTAFFASGMIIMATSNFVERRAWVKKNLPRWNEEELK